ncbi:MAG: tripartite tricarboxylate transporter TctB family protein [Nocardioidaceae bacterium]
MTTTAEVEVRPLARRLAVPDVIGGGVAAGLGAFIVVATLQIPDTTFANSVMGPRDLPLVIGIGMVLCGLALSAQGLLETRGAGRRPPAPPAPVPRQSLRQFVVIVAMLLVYLLVFIPLGYVLSTFAFLMASTSYFDRTHLRRNLVYSIAFAVVVFYGFNEVLNVTLPDGLLGSVL